VFVKDTKTSV